MMLVKSYSIVIGRISVFGSWSYYYYYMHLVSLYKLFKKTNRGSGVIFDTIFSRTDVGIFRSVSVTQWQYLTLDRFDFSSSNTSGSGVSCFSFSSTLVSEGC